MGCYLCLSHRDLCELGYKLQNMFKVSRYAELATAVNINNKKYASVLHSIVYKALFKQKHLILCKDFLYYIPDE